MRSICVVHVEDASSSSRDPFIVTCLYLEYRPTCILVFELLSQSMMGYMGPHGHIGDYNGDYMYRYTSSRPTLWPKLKKSDNQFKNQSLTFKCILYIEISRSRSRTHDIRIACPALLRFFNNSFLLFSLRRSYDRIIFQMRANESFIQCDNYF